MTIKQIGASVRKARGQRSISEVAEAAGLERHQVTGIEQAKKERKKTTNGQVYGPWLCMAYTRSWPPFFSFQASGNR